MIKLGDILLPGPMRPSHCSGAAGAPEQWKCTLSHLASRRCHTRVSSDWQERGRPWPSMYCVRRMYAMQAASSPIRWTWGLRMVVCKGLLFLLNTAGVKRAQICPSNQAHWTENKYGHQEAAHSSRSRTCESPCPPPGFPEIRAQTRSVQGHRFSCHTQTEGRLMVYLLLYHFSICEY